jgi:hypothetical protein
MTTSSLRDEFRKEAHRLLEDALYTYKGHYDAEVHWQRWHFKLGIPATTLGALAGLSLVKTDSLATLTFVLGSASLTGALTIVNPADRAARSRSAAEAWHAQHDRLRQWLNMDLPRLDDISARLAVDGFAQDKARLNKTSPPIPDSARRRARKGIEEGEAQHAVDGRPA